MKIRAYYFGCMRTISLKLPANLLRLLETEARARGATKSEIVRDALKQTLGPKRKLKGTTCYDLSAHLVGSLNSGVPDLATNPKYMEGFGE